MEGKEEELLLLYLLIYYLFENKIDVMKEINRQYESLQADREYMEQCPHIEWDQDMGRRIPFCGMTYEPCDLHCREGA